MNVKVWQVSKVNRYIKSLMSGDIILNSLFVEGEISNFKPYSSGHYYFTLKDESSAISCVMFESFASVLPFVPENGMKVLVYGSISVYEKTGQYQIYAEMMEPLGKGKLLTAFEQLKAKLQNEGLFDVDKKKQIPVNPVCVAVITSKTGAAVRDIISVITRRNRFIKIAVFDTLVQGDRAPEAIVRAVEAANRWGHADTIILGRGGGSVEDLWAFNNEQVARAVFKSRVPIISAVGHETDFTITDFVSDLRAPTPSAAAELAVTDLSEARELIASLAQQVLRLVLWKLSEKRQEISHLTDGLSAAFDNYYQIREAQIGGYLSDLNNLSPARVLERGYSIIYKDGSPTTDVNKLSAGDRIILKMHGGSITAEILETEGYHGEKEANL